MEDYHNERWHRLLEIHSTLAKPNTIFENFDKKTTSMEDKLNKISEKSA
jgi:hypothetical protein